MNILFYGGHKWESGPWFRKQQFASRLCERGHKIFYIESSISTFRKKKTDSNYYFKTQFNKITENLYIITPSALFPLPNNYYSRKLFNLKLLRDIKIFFKKNKIQNFIVWFNQVEFSSIIHKIEQFKIFDLADDRPYYCKLANDENGYKNLLKYVKTAFSKSDISIVSAYKIKEKYQRYSHSEILIIPNGHNINLNNKIKYNIPNDIKNIKHPIVGFVGTLFRFLDENLLAYIISKRQNYSFVFVGPRENNFQIEKIRNYKNVHLLGMKNKSDIPSYINSFSVCINPFKVHEVNDSVSPVKVFEYLALNKQVVSTEMYSLQKEKIAKNIVFAKDYDEFLLKLDDCIKNTKNENIPSIELLQRYSWDNLFISLVESINRTNKINL